ncbi:MAG TPA: hypothetical protein VF990_14650, partial [Candidatus Dormibacteraeota bacterium]
LALTLAEQPQPAVEEVARATSARHQAGVELEDVLGSIIKDDSGYVGKCVKTEITRTVNN